MKATGFVRNIDYAGRLVIPPGVCAALGVEKGKDSFEIFLENDKIILKKYKPGCAFCGSVEHLLDFENTKICAACSRKIANLLSNKTEKEGAENP